MDFPADMFVKAIDGDDDLFAFRYDFVPEVKAVEDGSTTFVTEGENGDLICEGYAAVWDGDDREGENFAPGAFQEGIKAFLKGQAGHCYHHKHDKLLGRFTHLEEDGKGLKFRSVVDGVLATDPEMKRYYHQLKSGSLRGMSVGGFFKRGMIDGKPKIVGVDITEISSTPVPVHPGTSLAVVAGKALQSMPDVPGEVVGGIRSEDEDSINWAIDNLNMTFDRIVTGVRNRSNNSASA